MQPPCGLLLNGPSGCGKTFLATAIAGELGLPFFKASGPELIGGTSGESEGRIRDIFQVRACVFFVSLVGGIDVPLFNPNSPPHSHATDRAPPTRVRQLAAEHRPSVLFIDGLDVIAGKRDGAQRGMDRRIVAQLFDCIDGLIDLDAPDGGDGAEEKRGEKENGSSSGSSGTSGGGGTAAKKHGAVVLLAATNKCVSPSLPHITRAFPIHTRRYHTVPSPHRARADALDPGVRGRFARELSLPVPDAPSRTKILALMASKVS